MMNKRETSFGSLEPILLDNAGNVIAEIAKFEREGRDHSHKLWENCYIQNGRGVIVNGNEKYEVGKGDAVSIPPRTSHWMIPYDNGLEILLVYSENGSGRNLNA